MVTHSSILVWRIPWTEEPGGLQSLRSQRAGHNWVTFTFVSFSPLCRFLFLFTFFPFVYLSVFLSMYLSLHLSVYIYFEIAFRKGILYSFFIFLSILIIAVVSVPSTRNLDSSWCMFVSLEPSMILAQRRSSGDVCWQFCGDKGWCPFPFITESQFLQRSLDHGSKSVNICRRSKRRKQGMHTNWLMYWWWWKGSISFKSIWNHFILYPFPIMGSWVFIIIQGIILNNEARWLGIKFWLHHVSAVWLWASCWTSLGYIIYISSSSIYNII